MDVNERAVELARANAASAGTSNVTAGTPEQIPAELQFDAIYSNPPVRVGKAPLHRLLLEWLRLRYTALPYSVAGFSFGSRIALRLGCSVEGVRRIIAVGFPTKSANVEYLKDCVTPKVFVQSTNDEHGPRPELEAIYRDIAEPKQIHWIPSADHFFRDGLDALEETIFQLKA